MNLSLALNNEVRQTEINHGCLQQRLSSCTDLNSRLITPRLGADERICKMEDSLCTHSLQEDYKTCPEWLSVMFMGGLAICHDLLSLFSQIQDSLLLAFSGNPPSL